MLLIAAPIWQQIFDLYGTAVESVGGMKTAVTVLDGDGDGPDSH